MDRPPERPTLTIACAACEGRGNTVHPTATTGGTTVVVPRQCAACEGTGKRQGFQPPV